MPMVAARFPAQEVYDRAAVEIGEHLAAGRDVAALCEGDPFFYGSFMYLFGRTAERFPVEVVPGVSSLTACAAVLGAPLAARDGVLTGDRRSVVWGKSVSVRVEHGGRRMIEKKSNTQNK